MTECYQEVLTAHELILLNSSLENINCSIETNTSNKDSLQQLDLNTTTLDVGNKNTNISSVTNTSQQLELESLQSDSINTNRSILAGIHTLINFIEDCLLKEDFDSCSMLSREVALVLVGIAILSTTVSLFSVVISIFACCIVINSRQKKKVLN
jgi:hypothetical protein